jgi:hypothetical protein
MADGAEKSLLKRLFRILGRADDPQGGTIELRCVGREEAAQRLAVTIQCLLKPHVWKLKCVAIFL